MQKEVSINNTLLMIQYIPNMLDVAQDNNTTFYNLEQICKKNQIELAPNPINLLSLNQSGFDLNEFYFVSDGHWTPKAHEVVAMSASIHLNEIFNKR